jgi:hypothetical protein
MVGDDMNVYYGNFSKQSDVEQEFGLPDGYLNNCEVLLAWYEYENYEGASFVLFKRGGKLYEVYGSHCSCYGLEGQFDEEETTVEALEHYLTKGDYRCQGHSADLYEVIDKLKRGKGMKKVVYYEASDGERFEQEHECLEYEERLELVDLIVNTVHGISREESQRLAQTLTEKYNLTSR